MKVGQTLFIVQTLGGDVISIRKSELFVKSDIAKAKKAGHDCIVVETKIAKIRTES